MIFVSHRPLAVSRSLARNKLLFFSSLMIETRGREREGEEFELGVY
jgi:hypothetical protein